MTTPVSPNKISLSDLQAEFGGQHPISISEYYSSATGVPTQGALDLTDFYGRTKPTTLTSGINVQQIYASSYISDGGILEIPANVWVWSDNTNVPALIVDVNNCIIINNGKIIGKGGQGGEYGSVGYPGGPAIGITGSNVLIQNNAGAYIAGGGGGGGSQRGAGGGGAGASNSVLVSGGSYGGGDSTTSGNGNNGTANTGGGGGGTGQYTASGGSGGSGVVVIRYAI